MSLLEKFFNKEAGVSNVAIAPEIYRSVRVMRDDLNEMEGKPKESFRTSSESDQFQAGNPFLGGESLPPVPDTGSGKEQQALSAPRSLMDRRKAVIVPAVGLFILFLLALAAYFFFRGGSDAPAEPAGVVTVPSESAAPMPQELPSAPKNAFSTAMPNYLQIDPESDTATPDGIFMKISDVAGKAKTMSTSDPVEFLVRDMNNNPIAFSRFAYLAKLGIPEEALALIDESFSLYLVPDGGDIRFALSLESKDAGKLAASVTAKESALPTWFGRLLYDPAVRIPSLVSFRNGAYGTISTRFAAVDEVRNYSFDYAFIGEKWVIGTSMDSFRATLGKIVMEQTK